MVIRQADTVKGIVHLLRAGEQDRKLFVFRHGAVVFALRHKGIGQLQLDFFREDNACILRMQAEREDQYKGSRQKQESVHETVHLFINQGIGGNRVEQPAAGKQKIVGPWFLE